MIPDAAKKKHLAILGINGAGKSSVDRGALIEPALIAGERVCMIDPKGEAWGLRLGANGKEKGGLAIYIVGGERQDFPLNERDGALWAEIVGTSSDSFAFDLSQLTVGARSRFFTSFAETLLRKNKGPLNLTIDEIHLFAPQSGSKAGGEVPAMLHATNNLLALGRSKGLRVRMISQRPAKVHKDALTQAHCLIAMMMVAPQDRNAVKEWIADQADAERGKEIIASLPSLKPGEAWVWSPADRYLERVRFPMPKTYDSSKAPDEIEGEAVTLKPIDPAAVSDRLKKVAEDVKANDPARLKAEVGRLTKAAAELEARLLKAPTTTVQPADMSAKIEAARAEGFAEGHLAGSIGVHERVRAASEEAIKAIRDAIQAVILPRLDALRAEISKTGHFHAPARPTERPVQAIPAPRRPDAAAKAGNRATVALKRPNGASGGSDTGDLPKGERAVLIAAAQHGEGVSREQLTQLTGYKRSTRDAYVLRLITRGYLTAAVTGSLTATQEGIAALGSDYEPLPTGRDLLEYWRGRLPQGERTILEILADEYPDAVSVDDLTERSGYQRSTRDAYLLRLANRKLIVRGPGSAQMAEGLA